VKTTIAALVSLRVRCTAAFRLEVRATLRHGGGASLPSHDCAYAIASSSIASRS
jgi:hypothetical protein